jgi:2-iminobutanoate/2-iminopropanoate deaminase
MTSSKETSMMRREVINPSTLGEPVGPFARAVRIGDVLHVAGTSAISHLSGPLNSRAIPPGAEEQARLTFQNIGKVLEAAGAGFGDIYRMLVIVNDAKQMRAVNKVRIELFPTANFISTAMIAGLLRDDMLVEIEVSAIVPAPA